MSLILTMIREALDADRAAAGDTQHKLDIIIQGIHRMSADIDALKAQVAASDTVMQSAKLVIDGFADRITAALAAADPVAELTAMASDLKSNSDALAASVVQNTPAAAAPVTTDPAAPTQVATPIAADTAPVDASTSTTTTAV